MAAETSSPSGHLQSGRTDVATPALGPTYADCRPHVLRDLQPLLRVGVLGLHEPAVGGQKIDARGKEH